MMVLVRQASDLKYNGSFAGTDMIINWSLTVVFALFVYIVRRSGNSLDKTVASAITGNTDKNECTVYNAVAHLIQISDNKETFDGDGVLWNQTHHTEHTEQETPKESQKHANTSVLTTAATAAATTAATTAAAAAAAACSTTECTAARKPPSVCSPVPASAASDVVCTGTRRAASRRIHLSTSAGPPSPCAPHGAPPPAATPAATFGSSTPATHAPATDDGRYGGHAAADDGRRHAATLGPADATFAAWGGRVPPAAASFLPPTPGWTAVLS